MDVKFQIESILFISGSPIKEERIAKVLKLKKEDIKKAILELKEDYEKNNRGIRIVIIEDKYQMTTARENSALMEKFLNQEVLGELTKPQLETLTIVAYRGPISKIELEQIRGVNCSLILRNLMIRGLIENKNEKYVITHDFLKYLGLTEINQLPDYEKLNKNNSIEEVLENKM